MRTRLSTRSSALRGCWLTSTPSFGGGGGGAPGVGPAKGGGMGQRRRRGAAEPVRGRSGGVAVEADAPEAVTGRMRAASLRAASSRNIAALNLSNSSCTDSARGSVRGNSVRGRGVNSSDGTAKNPGFAHDGVGGAPGGGKSISRPPWVRDQTMPYLQRYSGGLLRGRRSLSVLHSARTVC